MKSPLAFKHPHLPFLLSNRPGDSLASFLISARLIFIYICADLVKAPRFILLIRPRLYFVFGPLIPPYFK